jgi:hypothetical protein
MTPKTIIFDDIYNVNIERYIASLPLHRRLLARFFDKYKVTKKEYSDWFYYELGKHQK